MGATVAAEIALTFLNSSAFDGRRPLLYLIMLNGWLLPGARAALADGAVAASGLRALVTHGRRDEQVGYDCGVEAARLLREGGAEVSWQPDDAPSHADSGFGPGRDAAIAFLASLVGRHHENASASAASASAASASSGSGSGSSKIKLASRVKRKKGA